MVFLGVCCSRLIDVSRSDGKWITFTGDQLGALFASAVLQRYKGSGKPLGVYPCFVTVNILTYGAPAQMAMVASTVSSKMVEAVAAAEGFKFVECLTGELTKALGWRCTTF